MKILKLVFVGLGLLTMVGISLLVWGIYAMKNPSMPRNLPALASEIVTTRDSSEVRIGDLVSPGKPTILTFWASWCGQCYGEAKEIQRLKNRYGADKINVIYLNGEPNDAVDPSGADEFVADVVKDAAVNSKDLNLPPLTYYFADPKAYLSISGTALIVFPRTYVFDRDGKAIKASTGYNADQLSSELTPVIDDLMLN